ncbi:MAG: glycosyltransferase, partial [Verrucomicrobiales bacterium]|nr:glycosyltransferase [Verrucomicrobiales bacterium]
NEYAALGGMHNWKIAHYAGPRKPWNDERTQCAELFMRHLAPEDIPLWLPPPDGGSQRDVTALKRTVAGLERRLVVAEHPFRSLFYERRSGADGVQRKFKFFGLGIFSKRKQGERRVLRMLGVKISYRKKTRADGDGEIFTTPDLTRGAARFRQPDADTDRAISAPPVVAHCQRSGAPKVSVVVPVYNAEKFLPRALDSIAAQTLANIEIICVDDGSTDGSAAILRHYADRDRRFKIITQANQGAGFARNAGLDAAAGESVIFLDSDDYYAPELLEKLAARLAASGAEVCCCDYVNVRDGAVSAPIRGPHRLFVSGAVFSSAHCPRDIFQISNGALWNKLWRADFIRQSGVRHSATRTSNDLAFVFFHLATAWMVCVNEKLVTYTVTRDGALTRRASGQVADLCAVFAELWRNLERVGLARKLAVSFYREFAGDLRYRMALQPPDAADLRALAVLLKSGWWRQLETQIIRRDHYFVERLKSSLFAGTGARSQIKYWFYRLAANFVGGRRREKFITKKHQQQWFRKLRQAAKIF